MKALAQSEKRQNGDDDDHQANDVNNAVHLSFLYVGLKTDSTIQGALLLANIQITLCEP